MHDDIITYLDQEITRLQHAKRLLTGNTTAPKKPAGRIAIATKRTISPEARQRIATAQKKRWAKYHREKVA